MQVHRPMIILLSVLRSSVVHVWSVALVIGCLIVLTYHHTPAATRQLEPGLVADVGQQQLAITSPGRFVVRLDASGIWAWYDLQRDPSQEHNLVATKSHLLEHRPGVAEPLVRGSLTLEDMSPVRARVTWVGQTGNPAQPFHLTYTIWAGGQIAVATQSAAPMSTTLQLDPRAITGATLQSSPGQTGQNGDFYQEHMLYLDAWEGEIQANLPQGDRPAALLDDQAGLADTTLLATPVYDARSGALLLQAQPEQAIRLELPSGLWLRNPRFIISNWAHADLTVQLGADRLIASKDYLASWDATRQEVTLQYLHPIATDTDRMHNSFMFIPQADGPALGLSLQEGSQVRNLDNGQLWVDANLRYLGAGQDQKTTFDLFKIPYIQSSNQVTATATLQNAPADAGVRFVLRFKATDSSTFVLESKTVLSVPYEQAFTLPTYGEYILEAYILDSQQQPINQTADDTVDPLGYGHILVSIGDSITAGKWGYTIDSNNTTRYPVAACREDLTQNERSSDCRNFPQYDNKLLEPGQSEPTNFFAGYQVALNDGLRICNDRPVPVFVLNDGISGITTASVQSRVSQYRDHIDKLGAGYVLLQVGTNDANEGVTPTTWRTNMDAIIDGLQAASSTLDIWVARLPPRYDREQQPVVMERITAYNDLIAELTTAQGAREGPNFEVLFANQVFDANGSQLMNVDKLHPNIAGLAVMADAWGTTICPVLPEPGDEPLEPTATPTATPTAEPTATITHTELYLPLIRN